MQAIIRIWPAFLAALCLSPTGCGYVTGRFQVGHGELLLTDNGDEFIQERVMALHTGLHMEKMKYEYRGPRGDLCAWWEVKTEHGAKATPKVVLPLEIADRVGGDILSDGVVIASWCDPALSSDGRILLTISVFPSAADPESLQSQHQGAYRQAVLAPADRVSLAPGFCKSGRMHAEEDNAVWQTRGYYEFELRK